MKHQKTYGSELRIESTTSTVPGRKENPEAADFSLSLDSMAHTKNERLVARKIRYLLIHETVYQAHGIDSVPIKIGNFVKTMKDGADCQGLCQFG